ncbi:MAG: (d)CMP kinase [Verrucomicrobiota bacterium]
MDQKFILVTVDGGAATGKSTTSRAVSEALNLLHVDTGAHYRTLTKLLLDLGISSKSDKAIVEGLQNVTLETVIEGRSAFLAVNGQRPGDTDIRSEEVNAQVSLFAQIPAVRNKLKQYQRSQKDIAEDFAFSGLIMEGRDIGSVIFPEAPHRFFLFADSTTRTQRRAAEGLKDSIIERDKTDSNRKTAPLTCPQGAIEINTGNLSIQKVVERITRTIGK